MVHLDEATREELAKASMEDPGLLRITHMMATKLNDQTIEVMKACYSHGFQLGLMIGAIANNAPSINTLKDIIRDDSDKKSSTL